MARYSATVRNKRKKQTTPFLPENMQAFMARRMVDGVAMALGLIGLAVVLALISYNHTDPSWNTARSGDYAGIHNIMGLPGAYLADVLLQTIGLGGLVFGVALLAWGFRCWRRDQIGPVWARVAALMFASICLAAAAARLPAGDWLLHPWMGGSGGVMILNSMTGLLNPLFGSAVHMVSAGLAAVVGLAALLYACAVRRDELFGFMGSGLGAGVRCLRVCGDTNLRLPRLGQPLQ